ncbi:MAG: type III-B CRISPR module RAMP protein Cmr6 [Rhodoferax sp.]|nr:type III-B CRISPR module RAMP protein Cmr6 [Rhodoferax sp.]
MPAYIASHTKATFQDAPPGHKFLGYFRNTQGDDGDAFAPFKGKARIVGRPEPGPQRRAANDEQKREFDGVLNEVCEIPTSSIQQLQALRHRQKAHIAHYGTAGYSLCTTSTAPFATGLGNEHPIENGFAFLTPYGLPYLAGSGVKGILRRAARIGTGKRHAKPARLAFRADVWWLFGFEGAVDDGSLWDANSPPGHAFARDLDKTAANPDLYPFIRKLIAGDKNLWPYTDPAQDGARQFLQACLAGKSLRSGLQAGGALDFWDVFPSPAGNKLVVEIMTPALRKYYQGDEAPHDSGAPVPVSFLAVPANSQFDFHVVCHPTRLPVSLQGTWRDLMQQAFNHAFEWVGFGAKTSVGYGAMNGAKAVAAPSNTGTMATGSSADNFSPNGGGATAVGSQTWPTATVKLNPGKGEITASFNGMTTAPIKGADADKFRAALGDELAAKLKKKQEIKGIAIEVGQQGNAFTLKGLAAT